MKKNRIPVSAIIQILIGVLLVSITIVFLFLGKIDDKNDVIFAFLIASAGLGEGILGIVSYKQNS